MGGEAEKTSTVILQGGGGGRGGGGREGNGIKEASLRLTASSVLLFFPLDVCFAVNGPENWKKTVKKAGVQRQGRR